MSLTGNASGSLAAPWMGGRSGPLRIKPHAGAAFVAKATSRTRHHRGHPQSDDSPQAAPVVTYRVAILRAGLLGQDLSSQETTHAPETRSRSRATAASPRKW